MSNKSNNKHFIIKDIKNPSFLRDLNYDDLNTLSNDIRKEIIEKTSIYGGHLSSNLGVVEATIALHRVFDLSKDKLIFDVGHQSYTHKILTGRSLEEFRSKGKISGFQKIDESEYDVYEAGHSSTSISAANGFAIARDEKGEDYSVIAFIGDSALQSGLAFEGLNNATQGNHKVIIIVNDNEMSIAKTTGALTKVFRRISSRRGYNRVKTNLLKANDKSKAGRGFIRFLTSVKNWFKRHLVALNIFDEFGYKYIGPVNGHNIKSLEKAFEAAKRMPFSVVVHIRTKKGKGYSYAEKDIDGSWHGVSSFDIQTGEPINKHTDEQSWSEIYAKYVTDSMKNNEKIFLISPATETGSALSNCFKEFKSRCIDVGICEEHAVTLASGLATNGLHPVISIYSTFMQRAFDEISHDIARMNLSSTFIVDRAGLVGKDGETHQGIYDEAFLYATPNTTIAMASSDYEAGIIYNESLKDHGPFFIRYPRCYEKNQTSEVDLSLYEYGKWIYKVNKSSKNAIVGCGPILNKVVEIVKQKDLNADIINALYLKPMDEKVVSELLNKDNIIIIDAYATEYGFVNALKTRLIDCGYKGNIKSYSVGLDFIKQATIDEQLFDYELTPEQIVANAEKLFNN